MEEGKTEYPSSENILSFGGRERQDPGDYAGEAIEMPGISVEKEKIFHREESFSEKKICAEEELFAQEPERAFFSDMEFHQYTEEELKLEPKKVSWLEALDDTGDDVPQQQPENILQQPDDYTRTGISLPENLRKWDVLKVCLLDDSLVSNESARLNGKMAIVMAVMPLFYILPPILFPRQSCFTIGGVVLVVVGFIAMLIGGFYKTVEGKFRRIYPVLSSGKRAEAVVVRCRKEERTIDIVPFSRNRNESDLYWLETVWRFSDESGKVWEKTAYYPASREYFIPEGSRGYVYYNPANPRESIWIGKNWKRFCLFYDPELA